jgi:hypothetical protein
MLFLELKYQTVVVNKIFIGQIILKNSVQFSVETILDQDLLILQLNFKLLEPSFGVNQKLFSTQEHRDDASFFYLN